MLLKIVNGSVSYRENQILEEINFELNEKDKVAIVGRNGCGKTTFLNSLIHMEEINEGIAQESLVIEKSKNITIGYLKQNALKNEKNTLEEELLSVFEDLIQLEKQLQQQEQEITDYEWYETILEKYKLSGGYIYKKEIDKIINKFGFTEQKTKKIKDFSGGERTKIALMKLLLSKPNILLLDEPTNHLDLDTIIWLENYLKEYPYAVVIVSHDRMFLDNIVNKVFEIEYGQMKKYNGNYKDFERQKKENYEKELKDYTYQQKEIKRLQSIADRFRYKPTKAKMALSKLKKIEQMTIISRPTPENNKKMKLNFQVKEKSGDVVLTIKNLEIGYTNTLHTISFVLHVKERLAILGPNGSGKSTLLKTIIGSIPKRKGNISFGYHVKASYFDQQLNNLDLKKTVLEEIMQSMNKKEEEARSFLGRFLFTNDDVKKTVENLSGGEKVRLSLAKILSEEPNLLILDEPTNHLDIKGKEVLEDCLQNYEGTILFVSHDRYFVSKIADSFLLFEKEPIYIRGTYKDIEELRKKEVNNTLEEKLISLEEFDEK